MSRTAVLEKKKTTITFHPAEITRNDPKLSQSRKIDDLQKLLENPEKYPEAFLNKSLIKISKKFLTSKWSKISNFADIQKLFLGVVRIVVEFWKLRGNFSTNLQ